MIYAVRCFVDPTIPMNEGCFRPVQVQLPEGTLVNPRPPAACGGRVVTVTAAVEAILDALAAGPPRSAVAASALIHVFTLTGTGGDGQRWLNLFYEFGGIGARQGSDGPDATGCFFLGGRSVIPQIEPLEAQYPFVAETSRLRPDSGGPGEWRGGLGVELATADARGRRAHRAGRPYGGAAARAPRAAGPGWAARSWSNAADGVLRAAGAQADADPAAARRRLRHAHVGRRRTRAGG